MPCTVLVDVVSSMYASLTCAPWCDWCFGFIQLSESSPCYSYDTARSFKARMQTLQAVSANCRSKQCQDRSRAPNMLPQPQTNKYNSPTVVLSILA